MKAEFSLRADFLTVYLQEAHPSDVWPLPFFDRIPLHSSLMERLEMAATLVNRGTIAVDEMVVDGVEDRMANVYGASPARFMVVLDGVIVYLQGFAPIEYSPSDLKTFLHTLCSTCQQVR